MDILLKEQVQVIVEQNQGTIRYDIEVTNTGSQVITGAELNKVISYDGFNIELGVISVSLNTLTTEIDTSEIRIAGVLPDLDPNMTLPITILIPLSGFRGPNTYSYVSNTTIMIGDQPVSKELVANIEVVELKVQNKCCTYENSVTFNVVVLNEEPSPQTDIEVTDLFIPSIYTTISFESFECCEARFPDGSPVPINTPIKTNDPIVITCQSRLPSSSCFMISISFTILEIDLGMAQPIAPIINLVDQVNLLDESQILLPISNIPLSRQLDIDTMIKCVSKGGCV